jgi:hypothetical protein
MHKTHFQEFCGGYGKRAGRERERERERERMISRESTNGFN